jgi:hypothetical protein
MADSNALLIAVRLIEHVQAQTKADERSQLARAQLEGIKTTLNQTLQKLNEVGIADVQNAGIIIVLVKTIDDLLAEPNYSDSDKNLKSFLSENIVKLLTNLYLVAGKYYMTNTFEDNIHLHVVLSRIVESCLDQGFYFGMEDKIYNVQHFSDV